MNKAFNTLVDDRTEVSVETGLRAAEKLQSVLDGRDRGTDVLEMKVEVNQIIDAVNRRCRRKCGARSWASWTGLSEHSERFDEGADGSEEEDDIFDPGEFTEEDDEF